MLINLSEVFTLQRVVLRPAVRHRELLGYFTTKEYGDHYEHKIKINDSAFKPC